jgi:amidase
VSNVCDLSAVEQCVLLRNRGLSARELLDAHLTRIEQVNPLVNAIVTLAAEQARVDAHAADERLVHGVVLGPLHGLPIAVKDTHDTAGIRTTSGSPLLIDNVPERDELIVERLKAGGAVITGKTNVPEFAAGSHTFNKVFGATRNPYDLSRSAGGSSGGAAAALATGMTALADGSDMGGSLRNPASFCNVVGLRPSPGRVPMWPDHAPWATMAVQGPMGRTVADVALLLSTLAGPDDRSPISLQEHGSIFAVPLHVDLHGRRVAWSPDLGGTVRTACEVVAALTPQLRVFEELGATLEQDSPDFTGAEEVFRTLRAWQFHLELGALVDAHPGSFKDSIRWNVDQGRRLSGADLARAEVLHGQLFHRMREFFQRYDVLLLPVSQVSPFDINLEYPTQIDGVPQTSYLDWMRSAYFVSATGCPAVSVPAAFTAHGLPIGLQIVGPHRADLQVLRVAHAFEQVNAAGTRRPHLGTATA